MGCSDRGLHFQLKIAPLPEMDEEAIFMLIDLIRSAQKDDEHAIVLKTEYDAEAAFLTLYTGEQERRFFHALVTQ